MQHEAQRTLDKDCLLRVLGTDTETETLNRPRVLQNASEVGSPELLRTAFASYAHSTQFAYGCIIADRGLVTSPERRRHHRECTGLGCMICSRLYRVLTGMCCSDRADGYHSARGWTPETVIDPAVSVARAPWPSLHALARSLRLSRSRVSFSLSVSLSVCVSRELP